MAAAAGQPNCCCIYCGCVQRPLLPGQLQSSSYTRSVDPRNFATFCAKSGSHLCELRGEKQAVTLADVAGDGAWNASQTTREDGHHLLA
jgi:hypothetical protein